MGISVEQYRAAIGTWAAGRLRRVLAPPPPVDMNTNSTEHAEPEQLWQLTGPWKLHALMLLFLLTTLLCHVPSSTTGHATSHTTTQHTANITATTPDSATAAGAAVSPLCQEALLLIAGVEPNPGPASTEDILAGLCATAPSVDIRDCLRMYNPNHSNKQHKTEFGKCSKPTLVATLEYLHQPGQDIFTKSACINTLVCRIQNLLPDECGICGEEYCVLLEEVSLLTCEICGQGTHNKCIWNHLGVQASDQEEFGPNDALEKLNPTSFAGLHYLCGACEATTIPNKEAGLLKGKSTPSPRDEDQVSQSQEHVVENSEESTGVEEMISEDTTHSQSQGEEPTTEDEDPEDDEEPANHSWMQTDMNALSGGGQSHQNIPQNRNICRFYRQGTCRYGLKGHNCPKEHPAACKKLMKHGNRGPNGCTMGQACDKFHPKMCQTSLRKRECFNVDCKLKHVTGTTRKKPQTNTKTGVSSPSTAQEENPFLEALQAMRADIMRELDQRLASLTSAPNMATAAPAQVQPHPPPTMPSSYPQAPMFWPHNSYPGQMFAVWPRGLVADTANHGTENLASTSQPVMLVQMPRTHWPTSPSSTSRDWSLGQSPQRCLSFRTSSSTRTNFL